MNHDSITVTANDLLLILLISSLLVARDNKGISPKPLELYSHVGELKETPDS